MDNPNKERQLDIKILKWICDRTDRKLQVRYADYDTEKKSPECLIGNKKWKTHEIDTKPVPNFCESLDYCYRFLVAQLDAVYLETLTTTMVTTAKVRLGHPLNEDSWWLAEHSNSAMALCLAVEKVIDFKEKKTNG